MEFKDNEPIYLQIEQYLYRKIALGELAAGSKIPSVRQLAVDLVVNVNTVQRALQQMNDQGILFTKRGEGNFVTLDEELIAQTKKQLIEGELDSFIKNMRNLGIEKSQLVQTLAEYINKENSHD